MLKSTRPSSLRAALLALPKTLDETYQRMLNNINEADRSYALTLLRWLAYAQSPLSLLELAEADIIDPKDDPAADGLVDVDDRGDWADTFNILAGFVTIDGVQEREVDRGVDSAGDVSMTHANRQIEESIRVRLAHFSVKEHLESARILGSDAKYFHLDPLREHRYLTYSCLVYLTHYTASPLKTSTKTDLAAFPLLVHAAKTWAHHASLQQRSNGVREMVFLQSEPRKRGWLEIYTPERSWVQPFKRSNWGIGTALYYASLLGLEAVVQDLLSGRADVNTQGGYYGNALQAASGCGHEKVVQILIDVGADVNAQGGYYGNALQAASIRGHEKVAQMLIDAGADVNARGGEALDSALQAATFGGNAKVVQVLIEAGVDVNAHGGGGYSNALHAASALGHEKVVQVLIDAGADLNAQDEGLYSNALLAASAKGDEKVVQMLIDAGVDVNAQEGQFYNNALQAASEEGHEKVVQMLIYAGADVNAHRRRYPSALRRALHCGHQGMVQILIDAGADARIPRAEAGEEFVGEASWLLEDGG